MDMTITNVGQEVSWDASLFTYDKKIVRLSAPAAELDTTGRARILVYGPYLHMPRGLWKARVRFGVDQPASQRTFRVDWGSVTEFASLNFCPHVQGVYELDLEHFWDDTSPCEVRFILMEASFDGILSFLGATISLTSISSAIDHSTSELVSNSLHQ